MEAPPFNISAEAINMIAEISALLERHAITLESEQGVMLRKANRIKTIHSSLAIEGNRGCVKIGAAYFDTASSGKWQKFLP